MIHSITPSPGISSPILLAAGIVILAHEGIGSPARLHLSEVIQISIFTGVSILVADEDRVTISSTSSIEG
jgi:hypothetical protein